MKPLRYRVCMLALLALVADTALATTYTYTGKPFTQIATPPYTSTMSITGTFDTASPLPANLAWTANGIGPSGSNLLTAWSFTDGVRTYTNLNSTSTWFSISTDASGNIDDFFVYLIDPQAPHAVNQVLTGLAIKAGSPDSVDQFTCSMVNANNSVCSAAASLTAVAMSGSGGGSGSFTGPVAPALALTAVPNPLQFGNQLVGTMSAALTVTVTAVGGTVSFTQGQPVTITNPDFTLGIGPNSCNDPFGKWSLSSLANGASCTLSLFFTPSTTGTRSGQIVLPSINASSPEIALLGIGTTVPPQVAAVAAPALSKESLVVLLFAMMLGAVSMHSKRNLPPRRRRWLRDY